METVFDWLAVAIFAGIVVLFLQRSMMDDPRDGGILAYLPPCVGCALANYAGNEGQPIIAIVVFAVTLAYIIFVLKPFPVAPK